MTQVTQIDHSINHSITEDEQQLASTYSDSTISFLYNKDSQKHSNNHNDTLYELDLAYGLIDLLMKNNYSLESLILTDPSKLANTLGIDQDVATIIVTAANKKNNKHRKKQLSRTIDHGR